VHFRTSYEADGHTFETTGMMFNVANRYATSRGTLRFDDSLMDIIGRQGLDSDFWQKNEIVKRTPAEEEAVEIFERDNLFGVY
jgi:glucan phosphoethanolaminetransferase (alkaline phosphatase superfamily)